MTKDSEIVLTRIQSQAVAYKRATMPVKEAGHFLARTLQDVLKALHDAKTAPKNGPYYRIIRLLPDKNVEVEAGFPIDAPFTATSEIQTGWLPGGLVALRHHEGSIADVEPSKKDMIRQLLAKNMVPVDAGWVSYLDNPATAAADALRSRIVMPAAQKTTRGKEVMKLIPSNYGGTAAPLLATR